MATDFFPVYFQACKGVSPVVSGVYTLGLCAFAPAAILVGLSVKATGRYRPQMWAAWVVVLIAMGLLSALTTDSASDTMGTGIAASVGYLVLLGLGTGYVYPVQSRGDDHGSCDMDLLESKEMLMRLPLPPVSFCI